MASALNTLIDWLVGNAFAGAAEGTAGNASARVARAVWFPPAERGSNAGRDHRLSLEPARRRERIALVDDYRRAVSTYGGRPRAASAQPIAAQMDEFGNCINPAAANAIP